MPRPVSARTARRLVVGNTVGFFLVARDRCSVAASLRKMATIPLLHALVAGLACRALGLGDTAILSADTPFRIAALLMSTCGMMVVGLGVDRRGVDDALDRQHSGLKRDARAGLKPFARTL